MPELPEVETIARGLDKRVAGDTVESVWIGSSKQPLKSPADVIASTLEGKRIVRVHRAGKHIVFDLEGERRRASPTKKGRRAGRGQPRQAASLHQTCAVDRPSWHDRAHGRLRTCGGDRKAHSPDREAGFGARTAVYRSADVWQAQRSCWRLRSRRSGAAGGERGAVRRAFSRAQDSDQERASESEVAARRGQYLCRRVVVSGRHPSAAAGSVHHAGAAWASCTERCRKCCARRSRWVDLRFPITWTPMEKKGSSSSSIEFMAVRGSRVWCAGPRSGALSWPDAAVTTVQIVKNRHNRTI